MKENETKYNVKITRYDDGGIDVTVNGSMYTFDGQDYSDEEVTARAMCEYLGFDSEFLFDGDTF